MVLIDVYINAVPILNTTHRTGYSVYPGLFLKNLRMFYSRMLKARNLPGSCLGKLNWQVQIHGFSCEILYKGNQNSIVGL